MPDENQGGGPPAFLPEIESAVTPQEVAAGAPAAATPPQRGLPAWFALLVLLGVGGLLLGFQELAALVALSGMFAVAQAADLDARWKGMNHAVAWVPPILGAALFIGLGFAFLSSSLSGTERSIAFGFAIGSSAIALLSAIPWFANGLVGLLFRTTDTSHTMRLAARLALLCLLLAVPGWFAFRYLLQDLTQGTGPLLERASLGTGLIGYIVLGFASVGFMVRRTWRETVARLAIKPLTPAHLGIAFLGLIALTGLNAGADWLQHAVFPQLWESDQRINQEIARDLSLGMVVLLGLSAGLGEELTLRGALQPKLGIFMTSLVFAALHVQYSWFGMLVIFVLGLLLGIIRRETSTTVAITIHVLYDMLAVFSITAAGGPGR